MLGIKFERKLNWKWSVLSLLSALVSTVLLIIEGPKAVYWSSGVGLAFSFISIVFYLLNTKGYPSLGFPLLLGLIHSILLLLGVGLEFFFVKPLSDKVLNLPRFSHIYVSPDGVLEIQGPKGWSYNEVASSTHFGVQIKPSLQEQYIGVSEVQILVRKLDNIPKAKALFLKKIAETLSVSATRSKKQKYFRLHTEPAQLLNNDQGIWSILDVSKYWLEMRQTSLFGIKNDSYLCSVTATGIKNHSTLAKVLCLGLFEKTNIHDSSRKNFTKPRIVPMGRQ